MSTLSGVSSKGEKGKSKYQSLDINSIYHKTSKGDTSEQQQAKSTVPRKHGMQTLGKVPSTRRAPVNLPSLKSENSGSDPTVSLVPTGGTGWGSKQSDPPPPPITPTTPATTSGPTQGTNAPAVVETAPVQPTNITPSPPQPPKPVVNMGGDKTWSSVMVSGGESGGGSLISGGSGPSFLAHQSPQFQAEFPSLPGEGGVPAPPPRAGEGGYGPGPSLRPQTEGSWAYQAPPPSTQETQPPRPLSAQFLPPVVSSTSNMIPQFKGVIPPFMLNRNSGGVGGFPAMFSSNFQNSIRPPKFQNPPDNSRYLNPPRPAPVPDSEDLLARPIIREEDLNRMDEISRDSGWATQDDIDYNQKLAFSDEENGNEDEKDTKGKMSMNQYRDEKKDMESEKENRDRLNMHEKMPDKLNHQPWQGRSSAAHSAADMRNSLSRISHSNATRELDMDDVWKEKQRQQSEAVAAVAEKAKQRKEEEEKRFEETRSKSEMKELESRLLPSEMDSADAPRETGGAERGGGGRGWMEMELDNELYSNMINMDDLIKDTHKNQSGYTSRHSNLPPRLQMQQIFRKQKPWTYQFGGNKNRPRNEVDNLRDREDDKDKKEKTPEPNEKQKDRESEERDWDNRRGGASSAWEGSRRMDDNKHSGRRDHNKKFNDNYKSHSSFDERDNDWREKPDLRERERPGRPDSRDSRALRENRVSREEPRTIQESVSNDYWGELDYDKDIQEEKVRRKESYKDDRREAPTHTRPGCVPGPITREKMEAYEHKQSMQAEKKELMSTSVEKRLDGDSWKKLDSGNSNSSWGDTSDDRSSHQRQDQKQGSQSHHSGQQKFSQQSPKSSDHNTPGGATDDKDDRKDDGVTDKKKDIGSSGSVGSSGSSSNMKDKDRGSGNRGGRGNRGGSRPHSGSYSSIYFRGSNSAWGSNKDSSNRRGPSKLNSKGWNASESEGSGDEVSVSTESGKEDKKTDRKQTPRSPKSGERKKDKDDRNRESKKNEPLDKSAPGGNLNRKPAQQPLHNQSQSQQSQSQQSSGSNQSPQQSPSQSHGQQNQQQQQGDYEGSGGGRKEGFPPRGEPSRRGRGGPGRAPGGRGPVGAHYGPPGSKPAFPNALSAPNDQDANDSSSEEKKKSNLSGRKEQRKSDSESGRNKGKINKLRHEQDECETTSEGSDSESKGKQRQNKKSMQRLGGDKRNAFGPGQMNGRPRSEDGKGEKSRLGKEDEEGSRYTNHSDIFHSNNGFQEVKSKKTGKDTRPLGGKDELKRMRGNKEKGKGLQGGNTKGPQGKSFQREWLSNKPPRMQRMAYLQQQQNQQQETTVSDMNKINQNISMFPIRDVSCPAPAPPPPVNAWDKPITPALRTSSPPSNLHHLVPQIPNAQEKNVIELNERGPSGTSSQTSSPSTDKALSKIARETVEKSFLDGSTPPVQTIVFENTNLKGGPGEMALKNKYPQRGQRIEKGRERKLDEELDGNTSPHMGLGSFKPGNEIKPGENKNQESIQMAMSFSKTEDNADMKLDFPFESDLTHLTDDKNNIPRSIHQVIGQNPTADLDQKIASVKKVWETSMEHQHHEEAVSTTSSFTPNFGSAVNSSLDHSSAHQVDDTTFTSDVYTPTPQMQGSASGYSSGGANIIKQEPTNPTSNVKPQPQQTAMSSAIGTHSGQNLSSPPPPFAQQGHYGYQTQYASNIPAIPSPPAVLINSAAASAQQVPSHQGELFHNYTVSGPTVMGNQQGRSGYSQYPYGLSQGLGSGSAFSQQNVYHLAQPAAPPNPDVYSSINQYRLPPSAAYGQSQQLSNNPSTVLMTSSSNSLMSASVKSSPQPPPSIGAIGSKAGYQSSAHPSGLAPLGFIYDPLLPQSFLQNSLVQRHGGNNVMPAIQPTTSFYSGSAGGQTGLFQPGNSILTAAGSQPAQLHSATFSMQGFGAQSANAPPSSNPVGVQSYSSQMGHFRGGQTPGGTYLKAGGNPVTGQHSADPSKSPSTNQQDVMNCSVFSSSGGGQIPSPKSRSSGNSGGGGKQPQPSQQPSPTQAPPHHKFPYQQQNMVMQGSGGSVNQQSGGGSRGPLMQQGVRNTPNSGNGLNSNGLGRYPAPIQRPQGVGVGYQNIPQPRHRPPQPPRSQHQQHLKISNSYYQPQGNPVKLDVEGKDSDKLQEATNPAKKSEKKEEPASSSDQ